MRPNLPAPGTPIHPTGRNSMRGMMQELATAAESAPPGTMLQNGIAGTFGIQETQESRPQIAVYQVMTRWSPGSGSGSSSSGIAFTPQNCASAKAKLVYFLQNGIWQKLSDSVDPIYETIYHPLGYQIDSTDPYRAMPASLQSAPEFMPAIGVGQFVWCFFDETAGVWQVLEPFEDIVRVQLVSNWYACSKTTGNILIANVDIVPGSGSSSGTGQSYQCLSFQTGYAITVYDPIGTIENDPLAEFDIVKNQGYIPAGMTAYVKRMADANSWEPLKFGQSCVCAGSSSSSGSSGSGSSGSSSSGSSSSSGVTCYPVGQLSNVPGYNSAAGVVQVLTQTGGCLQWVTTGTC